MEPAASSMFSALRKEVKELKAFLDQIDGRLKVIEDRYEKTQRMHSGMLTVDEIKASWLGGAQDIIDKLGQD